MHILCTYLGAGTAGCSPFCWCVETGCGLWGWLWAAHLAFFGHRVGLGVRLAFSALM